MNYARNITTQELAFFSNAMPPQIRRADDWAFWTLPSDQNASTFGGKLIGEDPEQRCNRTRHAHKIKGCSSCAAASVLKK